MLARGGRPILICEEGDEELLHQYPSLYALEVPRTVDCLQGKNTFTLCDVEIIVTFGFFFLKAF